MERYKIIILGLSVFVILFFIAIIAVFLAYIFYINIDTDTIDMQFEVADKIGFNVGTDAIYFGKTYPNGMAKRTVTIDNNYNFPIHVLIKTDGDISPMVTVSDNDFIVEPYDKKDIIFYADSDGFPLGNYTGKATVTYKRALFRKL